MNIIQALILGIVQGLTEFLPVSSSGHLVLIQNYFQEVNVGFDVIIHLATLLAIFVFFFNDIIDLIKGFFTFSWKDERFRTVIYILLATLPIALIGYYLKDIIYNIFSNLYVVSLGFFISGMFLFTASFARELFFLEKRTTSIKKNYVSLNLKNSFVIGLVQMLALVPGISRSGSTVSTGILQGIDREKAIRFSFLLAIPAMIGANILNFTDLKIIELWPFITGFVAAFIFGLLGIFIFVKYLKLKRFRYFAYYCWLLAVLTLISQVL